MSGDGAPLDVVLVGCGSFARLYHAPALAVGPAVKVRAIVEPAPHADALALAARAGAAVVERLEDAPGGTDPTLAIVSTPHALHAAHVRAALARGWHVLCDKPFVLRLADALDLAADASARGLVGAVAFNRRLDAGCMRARDLIRSGALGAIRHLEAVQLGYRHSNWLVRPDLGGGGPFTGRGAHMADLLPWLVDETPQAVAAWLKPGPRATPTSAARLTCASPVSAGASPASRMAATCGTRRASSATKA